MSESDGGRRVKTVVTTDILRTPLTTASPTTEETDVPTLLRPGTTTSTVKPFIASIGTSTVDPLSTTVETSSVTIDHPMTTVPSLGHPDLKEFVASVHASQIGLWIVVAFLLVGCLGTGAVAFYCHRQHVSSLIFLSMQFRFFVALITTLP
jgi:hypothetical protein